MYARHYSTGKAGIKGRSGTFGEPQVEARLKEIVAIGIDTFSISDIIKLGSEVIYCPITHMLLVPIGWMDDTQKLRESSERMSTHNGQW